MENPLYERIVDHSNPLHCSSCNTMIPEPEPFWIRLSSGVCLCESCHAIEENEWA